MLTTHRLIWVDASKAPAPGASCYVHLSCVESIELNSTKLWSQTKLRVRVYLDPNRRPASGMPHRLAVCSTALSLPYLTHGVYLQTCLLCICRRRRIHQARRAQVGQPQLWWLCRCGSNLAVQADMGEQRAGRLPSGCATPQQCRRHPAGTAECHGILSSASRQSLLGNQKCRHALAMAH